MLGNIRRMMEMLRRYMRRRAEVSRGNGDFSGPCDERHARSRSAGNAGIANSIARTGQKSDCATPVGLWCRGRRYLLASPPVFGRRLLLSTLFRFLFSADSASKGNKKPCRDRLPIAFFSREV